VAAGCASHAIGTQHDLWRTHTFCKVAMAWKCLGAQRANAPRLVSGVQTRLLLPRWRNEAKEVRARAMCIRRPACTTTLSSSTSARYNAMHLDVCKSLCGQLRYTSRERALERARPLQLQSEPVVAFCVWS
jgi:hypothetical protein